MRYRKAIFLDKDGTLIPNIPYNVDPEKITLSDNAVAGLKRLQEEGYLFVVITNQSGIARGLFNEDDLEPVKEKIKLLLNMHGIHLAGFYHCPHHPDGKNSQYSVDCACRKPKEGLLLKAAKELSIDLSQSWMIGDILHDVEAGNRAGCKSIFLNNGNETEWIGGSFRTPFSIANDISEAAHFIINNSFHEKHRKSGVSTFNRQLQA